MRGFRWVAIVLMGMGSVGHAGLKDVRDFGAKGDGKADDTEAFARAVQGGGDVYVSTGEYLVRRIDLPEGMYLHGAGVGSTILLAAGDGTIAVGHRCRISNVRLTGQEKSEGKAASPQTKALISGVWRDSRPVEGVTLDHLWIDDYRFTGIYADHARDWRITECDFRRLNYAVLLVFSHRIRVSGCRVVETVEHGIQFWGNWRFEVMDSGDVTITDNYVKDGGGGAIWGTGARRVVVANNVVDGARDVGIDLEWCEDATITGNTVRNCENAGISLFFACRRVSISGNTVINDRPIADPTSGWWVCAGIWLTNPNRGAFKGDFGHRDVTIVGNTIFCAEGRRRAMWIGGESENITVANNTIRGGSIWRGEPPVPDPVPARPTTTQGVRGP